MVVIEPKEELKPFWEQLTELKWNVERNNLFKWGLFPEDNKCECGRV